MVLQLIPVNLEPEVVVGMHKLVGQRILHVGATDKPVLAKENPVVGVKTTTLHLATW